MKRETLPSMKEVYEALEAAAVDLYGFGLICQGGAAWAAEPEILETLYLGLENFWFTEGDSGRLSHQDFREELFKALWLKCQGSKATARIGSEVPLGHEEMAFYQLPQLTRAAVYLRTRKHFSYSSVALVLGMAESSVRAEVERSREFLLGRRVKSLEWSEEDF